ncbi:MAG: DNA-directed RNA polymerase subunit alpha C-terminal domain-containing protein, partial [Candidatus Moranbacteria bacterium]|nr:DNA-directed RNA polymerase subunit alpha C-terminal domain-containing protein [Candidatus Moranbacteria bacterium]
SEEIAEEKGEKGIPEAKKGDSMAIVVASIPFSTRTQNVLEKSGVKTIADLVALQEDELMNLEGMGEKGIKEIRKAIGNLGLTLKA